MSEIVDPKRNPSLAAQQLVVELIRAGKLGSSVIDRQAENVIQVFDSIEKHLNDKYQSGSDAGIF
ncbi:hypothetical protein BTJ39_23815 [Izhakiella australiensis]|uniref:Uncharacterized protein n=1 Tax=Izhakiella australiensis TaxID=1926881 RepID=A0A1S8Y716_9GAMM|nr:hypothetical protein [Izhakiella australiensis]OON34646.1 hypothetical protein BTJ39_23815 [Izhakiella australiensis]